MAERLLRARPDSVALAELEVNVPPLAVHILTYTSGFPLQMAERLLRAQPVSVANHVQAHRSPIERSVT